MASRESLPPIGAALRLFRLRAKLTQEELARRTKLHRNYIGGVERGERNPTFASVAIILRALRVSWSELGGVLDQPSDLSTADQ